MKRAIIWAAEKIGTFLVVVGLALLILCDEGWRAVLKEIKQFCDEKARST